MSDNLSPSTISDKSPRGGFFGFIKSLGSATENLLRRSSHRTRQREHASTVQEATELRKEQATLRRQVQTREAEIAHLTAVLESIGEGVIMQDVDGRIIMINEAARDMLGSQKAFWESDLARLFEKTRAVNLFHSEFEPLGDPLRVEINDRILIAQAAAVSDQEGNRFGAVIVLRDVTRAALAERLKDDFITQVSHELRTPLTAIKGMSDVLLSQPPDRPPNQRFLEAISRNVDVLDRMIVELLDISEISSGSFAVRQDTINLDELIWSVVRGQQNRLDRAELEIHVINLREANTQIVGDNRRLRWALGHLLENSINYTLKGGRITFRYGAITEQGRVLIQIEDNGVGINQIDIPHIFNRFYRGEARTPTGKTIDPRGLGQGLFIARAVAEAHQGYLSVDSKPGVGTMLTVALPVHGLSTVKSGEILEPPIDPEATVPNPALALPAEVADPTQTGQPADS